MKCKYCRHLFDGRKHACPDCGKDRHYSGPRKHRVPRVPTASLMMAIPMLASLGVGLALPAKKAKYCEHCGQILPEDSE